VPDDNLNNEKDDQSMNTLNNLNRMKLIVLEILKHKDDLNIELYDGVNLSATRNSILIMDALEASINADELVVFTVNKMDDDHRDKIGLLFIDMNKPNCIVAFGTGDAKTARQRRVNNFSRALVNLKAMDLDQELLNYADSPSSIYCNKISKVVA
jgi:hypothetical protein